MMQQPEVSFRGTMELSFFFFFVYVILISITIRFYLSFEGRFGWVAMGETGPNDTSRVVWTLGTYFFSRIFLVANYFYYI